MEIKQEKRRNYLKKQIYLTDDEKFELEKLDNLKAQYIKEVNERFVADKTERVKPPIITTHYVGYWFKKFWEFQNKKELIINDNNRDIINALCLYFAKDKRFEELDFIENPSLDKGIFLAGHVGVGKSSMLEAFRMLGDNHYKTFFNSSLLFRKANCKRIVSDYMDKHSEDGKNLSKYYKASPFYFDDLGTEQEAFNSYNVMQAILEERYDNKVKTFITSNLGLKAVEEKYGDRVRDRFNEMFNILPISGDSFRK
ncbi:ATP-binding protein [Empedobacter falsenii]|uniref:hypothetical protein n=1 Tax=Empedobacter falsenii TaxID=343874 RepID=UPI0025785992|nr:hypothetical protein [Empedobacter falsenii]MDM1548605.1 ATP-binding protein [Empedobacter falsenii]